MKELKGVCPWCMDCNRLEDESYAGVYRCKNFIPNQVNWEDHYRENLKKGAKDEI